MVVVKTMPVLIHLSPATCRCKLRSRTSPLNGGSGVIIGDGGVEQAAHDLRGDRSSAI
jgi:hypothetical protein